MPDETEFCAESSGKSKETLSQPDQIDSAKFQDQLNRHGLAISKILTVVNSINGRLDDSVSGFELPHRLKKLKTLIRGVRGDISEITNTQYEFGKLLKETNEDVSDAKSTLDEVSSDVADIKRNQSDFEDTISDLTQSISSLKKTIKGFAQTLDEIKANSATSAQYAEYMQDMQDARADFHLQQSN